MNLETRAKKIRKKIIEIANKSKSPHIGSSLSCVDIFTVLYYDVLKLEPWEKRDIFILSKGHAAMSLYSTLASRGIMDNQLLEGDAKSLCIDRRWRNPGGFYLGRCSFRV